MKYLISAVVLVFLQASSPVPRGAVNNASEASQNSRSNAQANKTNSTSSVPGTYPDKADISTIGTADQVEENKDHAVKVAVPPITVSKDSSDYALIIANLLLTMATLVIALFAVKQAKAAKRSADNDERTARVTQRADILLKDFEVRGSAERFIGRDTQFIVHFENFGPTRANNLTFDFSLKVGGGTPPLGEALTSSHRSPQ
jgi:hypothetical protein